jgi:cytoskeletal protein CcmA (bactofilin family)
MTIRNESLIKLAAKRFDLSESEQKLLQSISTDGEVIYSAVDEELNDPTRASEWGDIRTLRASLLAWLCTDANASQYFKYRGLRIAGAKIDGSLNLQFVILEFPLVFHRCIFYQNIWLDGAKIRFLDLSGSHIVHACLEAGGIQVENNILLSNDFRISGRVSLLGANIGGTLQCTRGRFDNPDGDALMAQSAEIKGNVLLNDGFHAKGQVWMLGVTIGGNLDCIGGRFESPARYALMAKSATIKDYVYFNKAFANGQVLLSDITIGGSLICDNSRFETHCQETLNAERAEIKGDVSLKNTVHFGGSICFLGVTIGGNLDCSGSKIESFSGVAFVVQRAQIKGTIFLKDGFYSKGLVLLSNVGLGGDLDCGDGNFDNPGADQYALLAESIEIKGVVLLRQNFKASGIVSFYNATVEDGIYIENNISLRDSEPTILDLQFATIRTLSDTKDSWPKEGSLRIYGFSYEIIDQKSPFSSSERLNWIRLQNQKEIFSPQPYEQLAKVLKDSGHTREATEVLIAKHKDIRKYGQLGKLDRFWNRFLDITIAHGYKPHRALWISLFIIGFGTVLFHFGYKYHLIEPSELEAYMAANPEKPESLELENSPSREEGQTEQIPAYPEFFSPTYSLDVFLPIVELHQSNYWLPKASQGSRIFKVDFLLLDVRFGGLLLFYFWVHILLGWIFTSLWVAGFSGLIRRVE